MKTLDLHAINAAHFILVNCYMQTHNSTAKAAAGYLYYHYLADANWIRQPSEPRLFDDEKFKPYLTPQDRRDV